MCYRVIPPLRDSFLRAAAVANKMARICYAVLRDGEPYGTPSHLAHKLNRSDFVIAG